MRPAAPALMCEGTTITYAELDARSDAVAAGLAARGIRPGDRVALQLPNIPEFPIAYYGILKAGAVVVPLNVLLRAPEIAYQLTDSGAHLLITWMALLDSAAKGAAEAGVTDCYVVGPSSQPAAHPFADLTAPVPGPLPLADRKADDVAAIVYTSGTTGQPKGAELTNLQLYLNADIPGRLFDLRCDDVVLTVLPMFHVFGMNSAMNVGIRFGAALSLVPRFTPEAVLAAITQDRATVFDGGPTMFGALLAHPSDDRFDPSSLRVCISGGDAIPAHVLDAFEKRFGFRTWRGTGRPRPPRPSPSTPAPTTAGSTASADRSGALRCRSGTRKATGCRRAGTGSARSSLAGITPCAATTASRRRRRRPSKAAGSTPATSVSSTRTGTCSLRLAAYKYPRILEFRDSLPLSGAGKVLKKSLV